MIYHFLRTVAWIVSHLPRPWTLGLGSLLGGLLYLAIPYRKQVAWQNLARAFPDKSPRQRAVILKDTYQHFGMVLMDFARSAIQVLLQRYQDRLEAAVRQYPEQYFNWFHRMWKTEPPRP